MQHDIVAEALYLLKNSHSSCKKGAAKSGSY